MRYIEPSKFDKNDYRTFEKKETIEEKKVFINEDGVIYPTNPLLISILFCRTILVMSHYIVKLVVFAIAILMTFKIYKKFLISWTGGHPCAGLFSGDHYGYNNPLKCIIRAKNADYYEYTEDPDYY